MEKNLAIIFWSNFSFRQIHILVIFSFSYLSTTMMQIFKWFAWIRLCLKTIYIIYVIEAQYIEEY